MRNSSGVQRGSVMDMPTYPGDPLTPGVGATPDAKRLDIKDVHDADEDSGAADFLRRMRSRCSRRCAVPSCPAPGVARCPSRITSAQVRRACTCGWRSTGIVSPFYNVVARMQGSTYPGRVGDSRQSPRRVGEWRAGPRLRHVGRCSRKRARSASSRSRDGARSGR